MDLVLQSFLILIGFVLLVKGAALLVDGACSIAHRYHVPDLVVGLTIVAIGTSAPELVVSTISAIKGSSGIAMGNVMGSNIANLFLVLGGAGAFAGAKLSGVKRTGITLSPETVKRDLPACLGAALVLLAMIHFYNPADVLISRIEAIALLVLGAGYMIFMLKTSKEPPSVDEEDKTRPIGLAILFVLLGLGLLVGGGQLIVSSAVEIAKRFGVSEAMIGLTIVALGTSLPELATCIVAIKKGKHAIAVGNVVGSNIMNTCLVLGVAGAITPIRSTQPIVLDAIIAVAAAAMLLVFMWTGKKQKLDRREAILYLVAYVGYMVFVVQRG